MQGNGAGQWLHGAAPPGDAAMGGGKTYALTVLRATGLPDRRLASWGGTRTGKNEAGEAACHGRYSCHGYSSRRTSRADLSFRSPRNRGCRSSPAEVHSEKPTWPTSFGVTH